MKRLFFPFLVLVMVGCNHSKVDDTWDHASSPILSDPLSGDPSDQQSGLHVSKYAEVAESETEAKGEVPSSPAKDPVKIYKDAVAEYVGLTKEAAARLAEQQGRSFLLTSRDGIGQPAQAVYVFGQVAVDVENGIVVDARINSDPIR